MKRDGILYVKQKTGCLPYNEDPKGFKSIHAQSVMKDAVKGWAHKVLAILYKQNCRLCAILMRYASYQFTRTRAISSDFNNFGNSFNALE